MSTGSGITIKELANAANGNFNTAIEARLSSTISPKAMTNTNAQRQAMALATGNPELAGERNAVSQYNPQALNTTPMLSQAQANLGIGQTYSPNMGLSSEGKYSGFYTASDRHNAVLGQAMQSKDRLSSQLRDLATARYAQIDSTYFPASKQNTDQYAAAPKSRMMPGTGQQAKEMPNAEALAAYGSYSQRDTALKNWYAQNIAPANEANESANANDLTPLSTYATAIASRNYNINPYAAAGEFNNADSEMYRGTRDQASMRDYGMVYDELQDLNSESKQGASDSIAADGNAAELALNQAKTTKSAYSSDLEALTGMNISALKQQTGSNEENLHNMLFSEKEIRVTLDEDSTKIIDNIPTLFNEIKKNIMTEGKYDVAIGYIKAIEADNPELASILRSYVASYSKTASKAFDNLYDPSQFQQ